MLFDFFRQKEDPYTYKMLCKNCDVFFEVESPELKQCPYCKQSNRTELYCLINKATRKETR
jgi:hypothetical protein